MKCRFLEYTHLETPTYDDDADDDGDEDDGGDDEQDASDHEGPDKCHVGGSTHGQSKRAWVKKACTFGELPA